MKDEQQKKWIKRAMWLGVLLGLFCNSLPPDYRAVCNIIANICTGG